MEALETFAVDDRRARFLVFLLGNPHLLEGGERGQDGAADPDRVLTLGGSDDLEEGEEGKPISKSPLSMWCIIMPHTVHYLCYRDWSLVTL